jgi:UDP-N-acetylmuramoyl-L-alanyl-D-glutamate--2,6-diaminopimelate ligase
MEEYARAKAILFEGLSPSAHAILNLEDPWSSFMRSRTHANVMTYGLGAEPTCAPSVRRMDIDGMAFDLLSPFGQVDVTSRFMGRHNLENLLAAASAALATGVSLGAIKGGIEALRPRAGPSRAGAIAARTSAC